MRSCDCQILLLPYAIAFRLSGGEIQVISDNVVSVKGNFDITDIDDDPSDNNNNNNNNNNNTEF